MLDFIAKETPAATPSPIETVRLRQEVFRVVHCGIILFWLVLRTTVRVTSPHPRLRDDYNLFLQVISFVIFQASTLIFDMRRVKFEVVEGFVALIDAKKNYVRYISHELRTPLNAAIAGIQMLEYDLRCVERIACCCDGWYSLTSVALLDLLSLTSS